MLGRLAQWALCHRMPVLLAAVLIGVVAAIIGLPPKVDGSMITLLPQDEPVVVALKRLEKETSGTNLLMLQFSGEDSPEVRAHLTELSEALEQCDCIDLAFHQLEPDLVNHIAMMQLETDLLKELQQRLRGALSLGPALNPMMAQSLLGPTAAQVRSTLENHPLLPEPGQHRIVIRPNGSNVDSNFAENLVDTVHATVQAHPGPAKLELATGPAVLITEGVRGIREDLLVTSGVSAFLVMLVLMIGLRSLKAVIVVILPLLLANLINLALLAVFVGKLTIFTAAGTAILIGLGIDFAVHLIARFREEMASGSPLEEAIAHAWDRTGPPCITAAFTSAAGFMALMAGDFTGAAQFGLSLAIGLMVCLVCMFTLLPALLPLMEQSSKQATRPRRIPDPTYRAVWILLPAFLLATCWIAINRAPKLQFEYDSTTMQRDSMVFSRMTEAKKEQVRQAYPPVVVTYDSEEQLYADHDRLQAMVDAGDLPHIRAVLSLRTLLPPDQAERVAVLQPLVQMSEHPNVKYLPQGLREPLLALRGWKPRVRTAEDLPQGVLRLVGEGKRILLLPEGDLYDIRESQALLEELDGQVPNIASTQVALGVILRSLTRDLPVILGLAFLMVALMAAADLKRVHATIAVVISLLSGIIWAAGVLQLLEVRLTLVNIIGWAILAGIGVDVVIHLSHRLQEEGVGGIRHALRTAGSAVALSTLTTIASFLALTAASSGGIRSLGVLVVIGMICVTTVSTVAIVLFWATKYVLFGDRT